MPKVADIDATIIDLKVNSEVSLFILLAADGSINRMGTDRQMFIGITQDPLHSQLMTHLNDDMLRFMGGYSVPEKRGALCRLAIQFHFTDGTTNGFGFEYGAESQGPPHEIGEFVRAAVALTETWYEAQKAMASGKK